MLKTKQKTQTSSNGLRKTAIFQPTCGKLSPQTSGDFYYVTFFRKFFHLMFFSLTSGQQWMETNKTIKLESSHTFMLFNGGYFHTGSNIEKNPNCQIYLYNMDHSLVVMSSYSFFLKKDHSVYHNSLISVPPLSIFNVV